ncbi:MAG: hypothetical protein ACWA42_10185, partial [Lutibacter sp.]
MRRVFLLLLVCFFTITIYSQSNSQIVYTISGKVMDLKTKQPIEDATIIFKDASSKKLKFGAVTNARGKFSIEVFKG